MSAPEVVDIREGSLSLDEVVKNVTRPGAGGIAVFLGVVRDESEGRAVTRLDYSAYDAMAKREVYLHCPINYGQSKLVNAALERLLGSATTRNWNTTTTLAEMASE